MVPHHAFVLAEGLPLTNNAKIDRKSLADRAPELIAEALQNIEDGQDGSTAEPVVTPANQMERSLVAIFAEVNCVDRKRSYNNCFLNSLPPSPNNCFSLSARCDLCLRSVLRILSSDFFS